ncbi:hypothetical protein [Hoeflea ulvae]|uniref:Uncharacterized protein n=1 Tax=Hoeflea ulvae TaxID=2983764 RepID=A0ABT3YKR1_9HYPH|nr:hypothetical protein [Hoeflea ulvae]MCY0096486.1 hypothetical protein [Hoeflea ulvae]
MRLLRSLIVALLLTTPLHAAETYDLIFKTGTLDDVAEDAELHYQRQVVVAGNPEFAARNTGEVELEFAPDDMAALRFVKGEQYRNLGRFPATVGNPIIMYFVETVLRDVAQEAGGSPFYIRNRIKDALDRTAPVEDEMVAFGSRQVAAKQITLHPFETDKNRDKMGIYADLALTFTMSEEVPGWYVSLSAKAPGADGAAGYSNSLVLVAGGESR